MAGRGVNIETASYCAIDIRGSLLGRSLVAAICPLLPPLPTTIHATCFPPGHTKLNGLMTRYGCRPRIHPGQGMYKEDHDTSQYNLKGHPKFENHEACMALESPLRCQQLRPRYKKVTLRGFRLAGDIGAIRRRTGDEGCRDQSSWTAD